MITYLLDINLLLALSDPMPIHQEAAHERFARQVRKSWATGCQGCRDWESGRQKVIPS